MWKNKAMVVLETMDYVICKIVEKGPHFPMYQPIANNAPVGPLEKKPETSYDDDDKWLINLDVKAGAVIGNSFPYHMYHLVQNCDSAQEMMETLAVAYEGTVEVQATTINNLNRRYEHFFTRQGETLTQMFNRFNCLVNDMRRLGIVKHSYLGKTWEHYIDVLKNDEKIDTMDLNTLFGNLQNYGETKALCKCKDLMKINRFYINGMN